MELTKKASETYRDLDLILVLAEKKRDKALAALKACDDPKEYRDLQEEYDMRIRFCKLVKSIHELLDEVLEDAQESEAQEEQ